jgi:hypothetical protein
MRAMIRKLLGKPDREASLQVAGEEWSPVPPSATPNGTTWVEWLQEAEAAPKKLPAAEPPPPAPAPVLARGRIRTPMPERQWRDVLSNFAEHLTDEELRIIRKQLG